MEEILTNLVDNSPLPVVTALLLGLLTAISPCPLATNITAIGFISRDLSDRNLVFINGMIYTLGRAITYTVLALVISAGASQFQLSGLFQKYGEKLLGPLLILIGLLLLNLLRIRFPAWSRFSKHYQGKKTFNYLEVLLLGIIFALAFCPYSGVLYFGILVPLTISSAKGLYLPVVFAVATGIPVIIISWLIAYTVSGVGNLYNRLKTFEIWFRKIVAILFIGIGVYYIIIIYFR